MLKILKIEDWKNIAPFKHYLTPLEDAITKVRKNLLKMHKDGVLRIKYEVEKNTQLQ